MIINDFQYIVIQDNQDNQNNQYNQDNHDNHDNHNYHDNHDNDDNHDNRDNHDLHYNQDNHVRLAHLWVDFRVILYKQNQGDIRCFFIFLDFWTPLFLYCSPTRIDLSLSRTKVT